MKKLICILLVAGVFGCDDEEFKDHFPGEWGYVNTIAGVDAGFSIVNSSNGYIIENILIDDMSCEDYEVVSPKKGKSIKMLSIFHWESPIRALGFKNLKISSDHKTLFSDTVVYYSSATEYTLYFNQTLTRK